MRWGSVCQNRVLNFVPMSYQSLVDSTLRDTNVANEAASSLAKRLIEDIIDIDEKKKIGYPKEKWSFYVWKWKFLDFKVPSKEIIWNKIIG